MKAGKLIFGVFKPITPEQYLAPQAMSVHDQVYELRITTTPMNAQDELNVVSNLMAMDVPGATVLGAEARGSSVKLQVKANQFQWAALFAFLPSLIGPIIALVLGLIVFVAIPGWLWAAIPLSIGAAVIIYAASKPKIVYRKGKGVKIY